MLETFSDVSDVSDVSRKPLTGDTGGFKKKNAERMATRQHPFPEGYPRTRDSTSPSGAHPACPAWAWSWNSDTFTLERVDAGSGPRPRASQNWIANPFHLHEGIAHACAHPNE